ncbi:hypothetical protein PIB30_022928 [Stylosanthes scabra]|uniref:Uncharacterized protein n=1 Tax=Stylosanthes scabra TaxID=79078 RepID=A0ABU6Q919_9FABA|nr:hypothetical protein [Stylosanthes scabra]
MARNKPSLVAKGKDKVHEPPTRASAMLAALGARQVAASQPETPSNFAVPAPRTAKMTAGMSVKYYRKQLTDRDGPSNTAPANPDPIDVSSDSETEAGQEDRKEEGVNIEEDQEEDPEIDPEEDTKMDPEEDLDMEPEEDPAEDAEENPEEDPAEHAEDEVMEELEEEASDDDGPSSQSRRQQHRTSLGGRLDALLLPISTEDCAIFKCGEGIAH